MKHGFFIWRVLIIGLSSTHLPLSAQIPIAPSSSAYDAAFQLLTRAEREQLQNRPNVRFKCDRELIARVEQSDPYAYFRENFFSTVNISAYVALIEAKSSAGASVALISAKVYGYYVPDVNQLTPVFNVELVVRNSHEASTSIRGKGIGPPIRLGLFGNINTSSSLTKSVNTAVMLAFLKASLAMSTNRSKSVMLEWR
jgi:hypothetical protein